MAVDDGRYKIMSFRFRKEEDAEFIEQLEKVVADGGSKRQFMRDLYYFKPEIPQDLCSIKDVETLLGRYKVPLRTRVNIIETLKKGLL